MTTLTTRLTARLTPRRRRTTPDPDLIIPGATSARGSNDGPLHGYPTDYYPAPAAMPTAEPNRADELTWVAQQIALHAAAGTLDEGTMHLLDDQITHREGQWIKAIEATTTARKRANDGLIAATTHLKEVAEHKLTRHHDLIDRARAHYHAAHTETTNALRESLSETE